MKKFLWKSLKAVGPVIACLLIDEAARLAKRQFTKSRGHR